MAWTIEILDEAVPELAAQPADIRAKFERIVHLIEEFGLKRVHAPYIKHLEGSLWEMRMKGRDGIARAIYVTVQKRRVVVVSVFRKKTQKTPKRELSLAHRRAKKVAE